MDGRVGEVVKQGGHLLSLLKLCGLVDPKSCVPGSPTINILHFHKCRHPVDLPVSPDVVGRGVAGPFAPRKIHVTSSKGVFCAGCNHYGIGDRDTSAGSKDLAFSCFLVYTARGKLGLMPLWNLDMLLSRSGWLIWEYFVRIWPTSARRSTPLRPSMGSSRVA